MLCSEKAGIGIGVKEDDSKKKRFSLPKEEPVSLAVLQQPLVISRHGGHIQQSCHSLPYKNLLNIKGVVSRESALHLC